MIEQCLEVRGTVDNVHAVDHGFVSILTTDNCTVEMPYDKHAPMEIGMEVFVTVHIKAGGRVGQGHSVAKGMNDPARDQAADFEKIKDGGDEL